MQKRRALRGFDRAAVRISNYAETLDGRLPVLQRRLDPPHRCQVAYTPDVETDTMVTPAAAVQFLNSNMLNGKA